VVGLFGVKRFDTIVGDLGEMKEAEVVMVDLEACARTVLFEMRKRADKDKKVLCSKFMVKKVDYSTLVDMKVLRMSWMKCE